jgi:hypothetical protein
MSLPHQGLFINKEFFAKYGDFDLNTKYCMDYELLLRAYFDFPQVISKDIVIANWRADGLGEGKTHEVIKEYYKIKRLNKVAPNYILRLIFIWDNLKLFLNRLLR